MPHFLVALWDRRWMSDDDDDNVFFFCFFVLCKNVAISFAFTNATIFSRKRLVFRWTVACRLSFRSLCACVRVERAILSVYVYAPPSSSFVRSSIVDRKSEEIEKCAAWGRCVRALIIHSNRKGSKTPEKKERNGAAATAADCENPKKTRRGYTFAFFHSPMP